MQPQTTSVRLESLLKFCNLSLTPEPESRIQNPESRIQNIESRYGVYLPPLPEEQNSQGPESRHLLAILVMDAENNRQEEEPPLLNLKDLRVISVLGRGANGVAFLVRNEATGENLALKVILKALIEKKSKKNGDKDFSSAYRRIWFERNVLMSFRHPLLPRLRGVVETDKIIAFAIDYCSGGHLHSLRKRQIEKVFSNNIIRFYGAELVLALEYLHGLGIVYRDLKPDNVMIQENGHLMLVDFDLSAKLSAKSLQLREIFRSNTTTSENCKSMKKYKRSLTLCHCFGSGISPVDSDSCCTDSLVETQRSDSESVSSFETEKSKSFVGTEEYVSPEIIQGNGHHFAVDWWGLGVVLDEMLYGRTPFRGVNRKETFHRILANSPELVGERTALRDLIGKLLEKDPTKRISIEGIKGHDFFKGVDWESALRIARPPFIPLRAERDMEGIKVIDVELFVHGVFKGEEDKTGVLVEDFSIF
ncbi:serine/threonine-protein kinase OXI1-like [Telopea speciosissima]|uniref:serine/threonine-protein kinase OXI1-like n=1 Tax=Telopea speciosissima TaxID=54955 RepID=UPI001CC7CEF1|nr:serine/threonine-protein kinase OXI1-like [Telopea speciosissima]